MRHKQSWPAGLSWAHMLPLYAQAAPPGSNRTLKVNRITLQTWWFDRRILDCLQAEPTDGVGAIRQVVVFGAGMDSRPWRLKLPPGARMRRKLGSS